MKLLVNIRGTSGSGKTTIVRKFMDIYGVEHIERNLANMKKLPNGEENIDFYPGAAIVRIPDWQYPIIFIGNYRPECGGLDTVPSQRAAAKWSLHHLGHGHVICEGLLTSGLGPKATFCRTVMEHVPNNVRFAHLDTPIELCMERIMERRRGRGDNRPLKDDDHAGKKHKQIQNVIRYMKELKYPLVMIDHTRGYEQVFEMLKEADNDRG